MTVLLFVLTLLTDNRLILAGLAFVMWCSALLVSYPSRVDMAWRLDIPAPSPGEAMLGYMVGIVVVMLLARSAKWIWRVLTKKEPRRFI